MKIQQLAREYGDFKIPIYAILLKNIIHQFLGYQIINLFILVKENNLYNMQNIKKWGT
jgi:hypothetical protein